MAVDSRLIVDLFANIQAPIQSQDYKQLYLEYLVLIRYVADLFGKNNILPSSSSVGVGLDDNLARVGVVREAEGVNFGASSEVDVDTGGVGGCGVGIDCTAVGFANTLGDGTEPRVATNSAVACVKHKTPARRQREKAYKQKRKLRKQSDNAARNSPCVDASGNISCPIVGVNTRGMDTVQDPESSDSGSCVSRWANSRAFRGRVAAGQNSKSEKVVPRKSTDDFGDLEYFSSSTHTFPCDSIDVPSNLGYSSEDSARESYWKLRHVKNCIALSELRQHLEKPIDPIARREKKENFELRRQLEKLKKELKDVKAVHNGMVRGLIRERRN